MGATVYLRFYEELNDYLPHGWRKTSFSQPVSTDASVGVVITQLGVPLDLVELILVNGESVSAGHRLSDGDRVSVYPMFESLDVEELVRLRDRPLRHIRFVVDAGLDALAEKLTARGFDVVIAREASERRDAAGRVLLTRDGARFSEGVMRGYLLKSDDPDVQLEEVMTALDLTDDSQV
ncbi:MAG: Mut7-C RNAse domain-containing protein [Gammaproteobacteria bacterium]